MLYERFLRAMALFMIMRAAAPAYFFVFWRWFATWRTHRLPALLMMLGIFVGIGGAIVTLRHMLLATRLAPPVPVRVIGWALIVVATAIGTKADRQMGPQLRYFKPFFDPHGRIELKTNGAYAMVRHPIYTSWVVFQVGTFAATGYVAVIIACAVLTLGATWFTRQEEKRLVELLEDPTAYHRYRQRVPALFPRLWPTARRKGLSRSPGRYKAREPAPSSRPPFPG
jgi:protein-S-isoprenylcysteine O-methyltransferase Ste14